MIDSSMSISPLSSVTLPSCNDTSIKRVEENGKYVWNSMVTRTGFHKYFPFSFWLYIGESVVFPPTRNPAT